MDGFFEKYGRVIIIAVAICFVLLYLTPMRNVVGSSINGFAGNFADKVGESLGTVKMPDGSANVKREPSSMLMKASRNYNASSFNWKIPKSATKILFTNEKAPNGIETVDLTAAQDGDVVGWYVGTTWKISTQDSKKNITFNTDSSYMFDLNGRQNLKEIEFNNIDTSKVTNMSEMFNNNMNLQSLDLSNFDTSKVEDMSFMFWACKAIEKLDLSSFDTSNVENMQGILGGCENLEKLDVSSFNTSNVKYMQDMFWECINLKELDLSSFDTSKVENMTDMFDQCRNLKSVKVRSQTDIDNFKTKKTWISSNTKFEIK